MTFNLSLPELYRSLLGAQFLICSIEFNNNMEEFQKVSFQWRVVMTK